MIFSEKLSFLLKLTDTSNKQLASALAVDPSLISRMRQARRNPPQNSAHLAGMANYFAKKCTTNYQRSALAETIGQNRIKVLTKSDALSPILSEWLAGDTLSAGRRVEQLIHEIAQNEPEDIAAVPIKSAAPKGDAAHSHAYYGNAGKRAAVRAFYSYLLEVNAPCTICITTDESLEWLTEKPAFAQELSCALLKLADAGYSFKRIAARLWDISEAVDSISRWLPVYMQGKLDTWYYRRIRDNVYRRTIFAAPGLLSISSSSVGYRADSDLTFLNVDAGIADAATREFNDYLALCAPLTTVHMHGDGGESMADCLGRFINIPGERSARYLGLPAPITPPGVLRRILAGHREAIDAFISFRRNYEKTMALYKRTDVIVLARTEDVREGRALCTASLLVPGVEPSYYTSAEYVQHLQEVLRLMEAYPDYTVVVLDEAVPEISICAISGGISFVIRGKEPVTLFEISEQSFVTAADEYIQALAGTKDGKKTLRRMQTMDRIRDLILALQE